MVNPSSTVPFRAPEANLETTTSWVPLATLHPSERGCGTTLLYYTALTAFVAWDPLMDLEADKNDRRCLPRAHTTWRWQAMLGPNPNTIISISFATDVAKPTGSGSGACGHQAYSAVMSSDMGDGSTFLACCPM